MSLLESGENHTPWHLRDNWEPMQVEITSTDLRVDGVIPPELNGLYVRTGPNPASGTSPHWFFGDGMLHGVRIRDGKAEWYASKDLSHHRGPAGV
ncbi:MAG: carotenoid oxygenase family protein [Ilumatobacteraceae bacterium]|nr:carotenoid oxygenase family protein [Ilumatobacteraceae bacterium]